VINLYNCSDKTVTEFGRTIWSTSRKDSHSFEEAASYCAKAIYHEFFYEDRESLFALVRFYRLLSYNAIPDDLKRFATGQDGLYWVLTGTFGDEEAWCDRHLSSNHQVAAHDSSPMFEAAYHKIDLGSDGPIGTEDQLIYQGDKLLPYFYVQKALGSAVVPSQKDFVVPYGIESVIGIGCKFMSKSSFVGLVFSKAAIGEQEATKFASITPYISTLLAYYDARSAYWHQS